MSLRAASVSLARFDSYLVPSIFFFLQALPEHQHPCLGGRCPGRPHPGEHRVPLSIFILLFPAVSLREQDPGVCSEEKSCRRWHG